MTASDSSKEILLDEAIPGMTLAEAVLDKSGARLIASGVALTEKTIHALRLRGVMQIEVSVPASDVVDQLMLEQSLMRLDVLFKNSLDNQPNRLLLDCLRRYRKRAMQ